jgi:hypothetical protein
MQCIGWCGWASCRLQRSGTDDGYIKHVDSAFTLYLKGPLQGRVDTVKPFIQWCKVLCVDGCEGVFGLAVPELEDVLHTWLGLMVLYAVMATTATVQSLQI